MQLITSQTLGSAQASITLSSIPQTFTDLVILLSPRSSQASTTTETVRFTCNGESGVYSSRYATSNGSSLASSFESTISIRLSAPSTLSTANTFGNIEIYIPNYASSAVKTGLAEAGAENNASAAGQSMTAFRYASSAAISSINFTLSNGNYVAGTRIAVYGITKGSDGITTAS